MSVFLGLKGVTCGKGFKSPDMRHSVTRFPGMKGFPAARDFSGSGVLCLGVMFSKSDRAAV